MFNIDKTHRNQMIILAICALFLGFFFFFGYSTAYNSKLYIDKEFFTHIFSRRIFKYRFLATDLFLYFQEHFINISDFEILKKFSKDLATTEHLKSLPDGLNFYFSHFVFSTFFGVLFSASSYTLLKNKVFNLSKPQILYLSLAFQLFYWLPMYVITPYDGISYILFTICANIILSEGNDLKKCASICALTITATMVRETAIFIPIFYAAIYIGKHGFCKNKELKFIIFNFACFFTTYFALRFHFGFDHAYCQNCSGSPIILLIKFHNIFAIIPKIITNPQSVFSIFFFLFTLRFFHHFKNNNKGKWFLLLCFAYIYLILFIGILWEIRLWIPVLMGYLIICLIRAEFFENKGIAA
jgi:hypothetical protein